MRSLDEIFAGAWSLSNSLGPRTTIENDVWRFGSNDRSATHTRRGIPELASCAALSFLNVEKHLVRELDPAIWRQST